MGNAYHSTKTRLLGVNDQRTLSLYLARYACETMFMGSNLASFGIQYNGADFEGEYFGCFDNAQELMGVIVHYGNGNVIVHASNDKALTQLANHLTQNANRGVTGILGMHDHAQYVIDILAIPHAAFSINRDEGLYSLQLSKLISTNLDQSCQIVPARAMSHSLLAAWMIAYEIEALGATYGEEVLARAQMKATRLQKGDCFVLMHHNVSVSCVGINAEINNILQLGPVWTPNTYRGQGFAKQLMSYALLQKRQSGAKKAVLFTQNPAAEKIYTATGFKRIGTYRLALLKESFHTRKIF